MVHQYISKLKLLQGTLAEPTIHDVEDATTGVNWFADEEVGFVAGGTSYLKLASPGYAFLGSQTGPSLSSPLLYLNRNLLPNTGVYTSINFTSGATPMTSLRSISRAATQYAFGAYTANTTFNTVPALILDYNNFVGINTPTSGPLNRFQVSADSEVLHASLIDAVSIQSITSSQIAGATIGLISANTENTTRGVLKGIKSKGTLSTPLSVANTDYTLSLLGAGHDGTGLLTTAGIHLQVMGTPSTNVMPQGIIFETGTNTARVERMRIMPNGNVGINTNNPGSKLNVNGGVAIGGGYNLLTISSGNLAVQGNIGVGITDPLVNYHSVGGIGTHFLAETVFTGSGGV